MLVMTFNLRFATPLDGPNEWEQRKSLAVEIIRRRHELAPRFSPLAVSALVSSRPARRRWSIVSGTPPARKTCTVGCIFGPLGNASTRRGVWRLMRVQSSTVGRVKPAE